MVWFGWYRWGLYNVFTYNFSQPARDVNSAQHSEVIDSYCNGVNQLIFSAYDNITKNIYVQMVDIDKNSSYNFTGLS